MSMTKDVSSKLPLDDVCYMIRNVVTGDYTWIEDEKYLSQMTKGYRQIVEHLLLKGRCNVAANAYIQYFLCIKGNAKKVRERIPIWAKEFEWEDKDCALKLAREMIHYLDISPI